MLPIRNLPLDRDQVHPWISSLLEQDVSGVKAAILERLSSSSSPEFTCLVDYIRRLVPTCVEFFDGVGYVLCELAEQSEDPAGHLYLAQPLPADVLAARADFFDLSIRELMREFLSKFAGCGERTAPDAGQFVWADNASAADFTYAEPEELGVWKDSRLLYWAQNGDLVIIDRCGQTAWLVMETNEVVPLFGAFSDFLGHYADFLRTPGVFDSWSSREMRGSLVRDEPEPSSSPQAFRLFFGDDDDDDDDD